MADEVVSSAVDTFMGSADQAAMKTNLALAKSDVGLGNVDNTSDATKNAASVTLTNHTMSGASNTFTALPATGLTGIVPIANLATGTPTGSKFIRDDNTLQLIPGGGDALTSNPLSQFAATTSSQLAGVISDETGTGLLVFGTSPTITTPTLSGVVSRNGAQVLTGTAISGLVIDVTKGDNTLSIAAPTTFTFSGTPAAKTVFGAAITTDGTARTITIPSSISGAQNGASITTIIIPASTTWFFQWFYDGTNYQITGDPVLTSGSGATYLLATGSTPASITLTNGTGLPISSGVSGLGTGVATFLATPSSANLLAAVTDETGTGALVFATSPTFATPILGTPASGNLTNCTADGTNLLGYRGAPQNSQSTAYTTVLLDAGKCIFHPVGDNNARTFTIDSNANVAYVIGTIIEFVNMAAASATIAITSDAMTLLPAGTTGSRTLAQYGRASAEKITSTSWVISGNSALT